MEAEAPQSRFPAFTSMCSSSPSNAQTNNGAGRPLTAWDWVHIFIQDAAIGQFVFI